MPPDNPSSESLPNKPNDGSAKSDFLETMIFPTSTPADASTDSSLEVTSGMLTSRTPPSDSSASNVTPVKPNKPAAPPSTLGRYEVRRTLGAGGFGAVYLGHDAQLDRAVAIKVLHSQQPQASAEGSQFLEEARRLARLRHPGIVTVHDVGVHEGQVYLVADYLEGPDLGKWLQEHRIGWQEATRIAAEIADALAHAHARLIVHRDIKPANIILTAERQPVLVDFGLALDEGRSGGREKGVVAGTPWYLSPEQATGTAHRIDGRTDIYSVGVVLYEMLTSRVPFRSSNPPELFRQIREDEPQPPRQIVSEIPPELEHACLKALAKRQQDRYTTASDMASDLRNILARVSGASISQPLSAFDLSAGEPRPAGPTSVRSTVVTSSTSRRLLRDAMSRC